MPNTKAKTNQRVGIFGGTFNPFHNGHLNSLTTVLEKLRLDQVYVFPAFQSPGRMPVEGASPEHRLQMVRAVFAEKNWPVVVDDYEIKKGGISYTIDTVEYLKKERPDAELFLIIGMDQFEAFDEWKDYLEILQKCHLVVTSRPDSTLPEDKKDLPSGFETLIDKFSPQESTLRSGKNLYFVQLEDVAASSTEVRKLIQSSTPFESLVPPEVSEYIKTHKLYEGVGKQIGNFEKFTYFCAERIFERKGVGVQGYDVRGINQPSEYVLIASGTSTRHATTLAEAVIRGVKTRYGVFPQSVEGLREGRWIVLDYGSLIVHLFYDFTRQEYRLEELWKGGVDLQLKDPFENRQVNNNNT